MTKNTLASIERLEKLAAWLRTNAEYAGAPWVWEARLRSAEDLERQAAKLRAQHSPRPSSENLISSAYRKARNI